MVLVNLMGGLGNQAFQYATGRSLSIKLNTELKLDHSFLEADTKGQYTQRHYELSVFNGPQLRATEDDLMLVAKARKQGLFSKLFSGSKITLFNENGFPYNTPIEAVSGDVYLNGFWQSEKYFKGIRQTLLYNLSLKVALSSEAAKLKDEIKKQEVAVSLHFRRGDYVNLSSASAFHGVAGLDYYQKAVELISSKMENPVFYIFSDEIDWVKQNFQLPGAKYISGLKSYEDLELMKTCRHNIIANSSFSWWGAWLNDNTRKIVVAPRNWFKDTSVNTTDLIPASWQKI